MRLRVRGKPISVNVFHTLHSCCFVRERRDAPTYYATAPRESKAGQHACQGLSTSCMSMWLDASLGRVVLWELDLSRLLTRCRLR